MIPLALNITNQDLLRKIQTSMLTEEQKNELMAMMPQMTENERAEISKLIDDSVRDMIAADPQLQKRVAALNEEYNRKIQELLHEQGRIIRKEFETLDAQLSGKESAMQAMELEMSSVQPSPMSSLRPPLSFLRQPDTALAGKQESAPKSKHLLLKVVFIIGLLAAITTGVLFTLQYLK